MEGEKTRKRRTVEQRLASLEKKQLEILERQKAASAKIEAEKRLLQTPSARKERVEQEKRFARALQVLVPEWDMRHVIAAVELAIAEDKERLQTLGENLLDEHGKARRGRRLMKG